MYFREKKAQISFEYLLTIVFAIVLVAIVTIFALNMRLIGNSAQDRIKDAKLKYFEKIFG